LNRPNPRKQRPRRYIRWQRKHSNSLWQVDWMFYAKYRKWLIAYLDDHSRFVTAAAYFRQATTENALELLDRAISSYGKPREIMSDRGTQFYAARGETSLFTVKLNELNIKNILASVHKPTTNGKIERWFLTFRLEIRRFKFLQEFVESYNKQRPHMSLNYKTPFEVFKRDLK
jgi:putative transposase